VLTFTLHLFSGKLSVDENVRMHNRESLQEEECNANLTRLWEYLGLLQVQCPVSTKLTWERFLVESREKQFVKQQ
jgi:hypothetical protein